MRSFIRAALAASFAWTSRSVFPPSAVAGVADPGRPASCWSHGAAARRSRAIAGTAAAFLLFVSLTCGATSSARMLLLDGALAGDAIVAVGERGSIIRSADSGGTWDTIFAPTSATLTGVSFAPDARYGWAVGHDAIILATIDGGLTWTKQWQGDSLDNSFLDVCAIDAQHVIAVGAYGLFVESRDAGRTWTTRKVLEDDMHLNRLSRGPTGTLYLAGERGTLLRSRDDGATWDHIESPYDGSFYGILPLDEHTLIAHGLRGRVFRSENDGDTWDPVALPEPALIATALRTRNGSLLLAGEARALYRSTDAGCTFSHWPTAFASAVAELILAPDGTVIALGEAGATRLPPAP